MSSTPTWRIYTFEALPSATLYAWLKLRQEVFVREQRSAYVDADGLDPICHHLLGFWGERLVGGARLLPPGTAGPLPAIGRVVLHRDARGGGHGRPLMREAMIATHGLFGPLPVHISAQAHLADFYASLGFVVDGPGYDEDGIPHLPMTAPPTPPP